MSRKKSHIELVKERIDDGTATVDDRREWAREVELDGELARKEQAYIQRFRDIEAVRDAQSFDELKEAMAVFLEQYT